MSTNLYKEAIAEAQQLKLLAEQNAKNKIIEALTSSEIWNKVFKENIK